MFGFRAALHGPAGAAHQHEITGRVGEQDVGDLRRRSQDRGSQNARFIRMLGGGAPAQYALGQQDRVRRGLQIGRYLQRDALPQARQQRIGQAEHPGSVGVVRVDGDPQQKADNQPHATERQANPEHGPAPASLLRQRVRIERHDVHAVGQEYRPSF